MKKQGNAAAGSCTYRWLSASKGLSRTSFSELYHLLDLLGLRSHVKHKEVYNKYVRIFLTKEALSESGPTALKQIQPAEPLKVIARSD